MFYYDPIIQENIEENNHDFKFKIGSSVTLKEKDMLGGEYIIISQGYDRFKNPIYKLDTLDANSSVIELFVTEDEMIDWKIYSNSKAQV